MKIYLVRHAIAEERDPMLWPDDSERPLTKLGVRRFKKVARGLRKLVPSVEVVLSSPYVRAWRTASLLEKAGWPAPVSLPELAQGEPGTLMQALQPYEQLESVALVGHEPHLSRFAASLQGWPRPPWGELKKGGALCIEQQHLSLGSGAEIVWLLPPRVLRKLG